MIVTTTPSVEGYRITGYYGIVFGEVITGINFLRDFGAGIRNIVGGRSEGYEQELLQARNEALQELEQRAAQRGLAAAALADQTEGLALVDIQRNAVVGLDVKALLLQREVLLEVADAKQHLLPLVI